MDHSLAVTRLWQLEHDLGCLGWDRQLLYDGPDGVTSLAGEVVLPCPEVLQFWKEGPCHCVVTEDSAAVQGHVSWSQAVQDEDLGVERVIPGCGAYLTFGNKSIFTLSGTIAKEQWHCDVLNICLDSRHLYILDSRKTLSQVCRGTVVRKVPASERVLEAIGMDCVLYQKGGELLLFDSRTGRAVWKSIIGIAGRLGKSRGNCVAVVGDETIVVSEIRTGGRWQLRKPYFEEVECVEVSPALDIYLGCGQRVYEVGLSSSFSAM